MVTPFTAAALCAYFAFHAFNGQYGIRAHYVMQTKVPKLEEKLEALSAKREVLERRVAKLREGSIERDMLEERARKSLGMATPDEVVILFR